MVGEGNWVDLLVREAIARKLIEVGLEEASRVVKQDGRLTFRYRLIKGHAHIEETDKFGQLKFSNNADNPIYRRLVIAVVAELPRETRIGALVTRRDIEVKVGNEVEVDITVQDAQVRTGGAAVTAAGLANVVNRGFLL